jgi:hypothetical protein
MSLSKLFSLFAVTGVLVTAPGAYADAPASECFLSYKPSHVLAYEVEHSSAYERHVPYKTLAGAHVFIPAEPGLTGEWLRSQLDRRAAGRKLSHATPRAGKNWAPLPASSGAPGLLVTRGCP